MTTEKSTYRVSYTANGEQFAHETYTGTLDYVEDCARAYIVKGEQAHIMDEQGRELETVYKFENER